MSKRPSDETEQDSKKIKLSDSVGTSNLDSENLTNSNRQGTSSSNVGSNTTDQSSTSNTNTLPRRIRTQRQSSEDSICLCYTPFPCPNPECRYTEVNIDELSDSEELQEILGKMLESVRSKKE